MSLHSTALQTAIYTLLSGDSTLDGLVGNNRIYDESSTELCISICCYRRRRLLLMLVRKIRMHKNLHKLSTFGVGIEEVSKQREVLTNLYFIA